MNVWGERGFQYLQNSSRCNKSVYTLSIIPIRCKSIFMIPKKVGVLIILASDHMNIYSFKKRTVVTIQQVSSYIIPGPALLIRSDACLSVILFQRGFQKNHIKFGC